MLEANKELLRTAWATYSAGDEAGFAACLHSDWVEYDAAGNVDSTLEDEFPAMRLHRVAFPDKHTEIHRLVAEGDFVVVHSTTSATHTGRYFDVEPTGQAVRVHEMSIHRIVEGRVAETWQITEGGGFYWQLTGRSAPKTTDNIG